MVVRLCPVGALTAALQNVVDRDTFLNTPRKAAMTSALTWLDWGKEINLDFIELAAALPLPDSYIDPATLLDPVAAHLAVSSPVQGDGSDLSAEDAALLIGKSKETGVKIASLGAFENPLHPDPAIRGQVLRHLERCARSAASLKPAGCRAVTGFIGADWTKSLEENFALFERYLIPLLLIFKALGVKYRIENCPMPGWQPGGYYFYNIAYCAAHWIRLFDIAKKHGVLEVLELNYDASHDLLMNSRPELSFAALQAAGYGDKLAAIHGKDQHRNMAKVALFTGHGQRSALGNPWDVMIAQHGLPGLCHYNPAAADQGLACDWVSHQLALRQLGGDPTQIPCTLEHEWPPARKQEPTLVKEMYRLTVMAFRAADQLAAVHHAAPGFCAEYGITLPGVPNPLLANNPAIAEAVASYRTGYLPQLMTA